MNRLQHLEWCKRRALEYVKVGDLNRAYTSFCSDMGKHVDTENDPFLKMSISLLLGGALLTKESMIEFINGFN